MIGVEYSWCGRLQKLQLPGINTVSAGYCTGNGGQNLQHQLFLGWWAP